MMMTKTLKINLQESKVKVKKLQLIKINKWNRNKIKCAQDKMKKDKLGLKLKTFQISKSFLTA